MKSSSKSASKINVPVVSSGVLQWDASMSQGGLPRGGIVEVFGMESVGKSTLCLSIAKSFLNIKEEVFYIDVNYDSDPKWINKLGIYDFQDNLIVPDCAESALESLLQLAQTADCIILDSVTALVPYAEAIQDKPYNYKAIPRMMSKAIRALIPIIKKSGCVVVFTSQMRRDKYGELKSAGREALECSAMLRVELSVEKYISIQLYRFEHANVGLQVQFNTIKNTTGTSEPVIVPLYFDLNMPAGFEQVKNENEFRQAHGLPIKQEK